MYKFILDGLLIAIGTKFYTQNVVEVEKYSLKT
jgi:hypothetical protein